MANQMVAMVRWMTMARPLNKRHVHSQPFQSLHLDGLDQRGAISAVSHEPARPPTCGLASATMSAKASAARGPPRDVSAEQPGRQALYTAHCLCFRRANLGLPEAPWTEHFFKDVPPIR